MAFKLNKTEETRFEELKKALDTAYTNIGIAVSAYNEAEAAAREPVAQELNIYNEQLAELRSFADGIASKQREEYDDKSESWQDGDTGQSIDEWINSWENAELEDVGITFPEEQVTVDFENHGEIDLTVEP